LGQIHPGAIGQLVVRRVIIVVVVVLRLGIIFHVDVVVVVDDAHLRVVIIAVSAKGGRRHPVPIERQHVRRRHHLVHDLVHCHAVKRRPS
jgi:hypothetical protein